MVFDVLYFTLTFWNDVIDMVISEYIFLPFISFLLVFFDIQNFLFCVPITIIPADFPWDVLSFMIEGCESSSML